MIPEGARHYLLDGLAATQVVLESLMQRATAADYDRRPDPERFTLREVVTHLADWETIWKERAEKILTEPEPALPSEDPDVWAARNHYSQADVSEQLARFRARRAALVDRLQNLPEDSWLSAGTHSAWGKIRLWDMAVLILGHDAYHLRQVAEWLA